jgi:Mg2+/Co2+ transporter CorB
LGDEVPLSALIGLLVTLLLLSAFFSGSETALVATNYATRHGRDTAAHGLQNDSCNAPTGSSA